MKLDPEKVREIVNVTKDYRKILPYYTKSGIKTTLGMLYNPKHAHIILFSEEKEQELRDLAPHLAERYVTLTDDIKELTRQLQERADKCRKNGELVAASGHADTIRKLEKIMDRATKEINPGD